MLCRKCFAIIGYDEIRVIAETPRKQAQYYHLVRAATTVPAMAACKSSPGPCA